MAKSRRKAAAAAGAGVAGFILTLAMFYSQIYIMILALYDVFNALLGIEVPVQVYGLTALIFVASMLVILIYGRSR